MPPRTSTDSQTSNYHSPVRRDDKDAKKDSDGVRPSSATYGAVVIVVFVVIALSIVSRILYIRRLRKRARQVDDADTAVGEQEERMAMQRRGEEEGLPTYRESTAVPNEDTVLAATPITDTPFVRGSTADTLPHSENAVGEHGDSIPSDDQDQPPKYESNQGDAPVAHQTHHPPTLDITNEMRMSTQSTATLVLPSIPVHNPEANDPPPNEPNPQDQPSLTSSSSTTPSSPPRPPSSRPPSSRPSSPPPPPSPPPPQSSSEPPPPTV